MIYEQLLHDFVDGSLDFQGETVLFSELQSNEGLRGDLKMLMMMQRAVPHDVRAFSPAADSHEAIFRQLGFASGLETAPSPIDLGRLHPGRYLQGIIGGVVGALLMAIVLVGFDLRFPAGDPASRKAPTLAGGPSSAGETLSARQAGRATGSENNGSGDDARIGSNEATPQPPALAATHATGHAARRESQARGASSITTTERRARATATPITDAALTSNTLGNAVSIADDPSRTADGSRTRANRTGIDHAAMRVSNVDPASSIEGPITSPDEPAAPTSSSLDEDIASILPFAVEYRQLTSRNFRGLPPALASSSDALLKDRVLSARYHLSPTQAVGVEMGAEEFYQRFEERIANGGDVVLHEQNPVVMWGGVSYRQIVPTSTDLRPYLQATLGAAPVGPVGRLLLGASYDIAPELQIFGGGEVSALAFRFNGGWYLAPKYGMMYGVGLRF
jgi:hypothetical protein